MKKLIATAIAFFCVTAGQAQSDTIEYFTDSHVRNSVVSFAPVYAPMYTTRRIAFHEPVTDGTEKFALLNEDGKGILGHRYGGMMYIKTNSPLRLGLGVLQDYTGFISKDFAVFNQNAIGLDTLGVYNAKTTVKSLTLPVQLVFHTQMTDLFALQIVPGYEFSFTQNVMREWVNGPAIPAGAATGVLGTLYERGTDITYAQGYNSTISFAMGGEFRLMERAVLITRAEFRFGVRPVNANDAGLREIPYSSGLLTGLRFEL